MAGRMLMAEVIGGRVRGIPRVVGLDGWCDGGLGQQRNDGGGCASMLERQERVESPRSYLTEWVSPCHFCMALCSFGPPSRALVFITWRGVECRYMMWLGWTVKRAQLLNIKVQMPSVWTKGCMLMIMCVLSDLTWLPLLGGMRKSWYIIIIIIIIIIFQVVLNRSASILAQLTSSLKKFKFLSL